MMCDMSSSESFFKQVVLPALSSPKTRILASLSDLFIFLINESKPIFFPSFSYFFLSAYIYYFEGCSVLSEHRKRKRPVYYDPRKKTKRKREKITLHNYKIKMAGLNEFFSLSLPLLLSPSLPLFLSSSISSWTQNPRSNNTCSNRLYHKLFKFINNLQVLIIKAQNTMKLILMLLMSLKKERESYPLKRLLTKRFQVKFYLYSNITIYNIFIFMASKFCLIKKLFSTSNDFLFHLFFCCEFHAPKK